MPGICAFIRATGMSADLLLPLRFKGARTYVQGPDILAALCDALASGGFGPLEKLDLVCHRLVATQLRGRFLAEDEAAPEGLHATLRFTAGGATHTVALEETDEPIAAREPYEEDALVAASAFDLDAKTAGVAPPLGFENAEIVTALNKALLTRAFPEARGKWLFTRLQLARSLRERTFARLEVRFLGHSNFRITRSALVGDGEPLGHLYFSLLPAA